VLRRRLLRVTTAVPDLLRAVAEKDKEIARLEREVEAVRLLARDWERASEAQAERVQSVRCDDPADWPRLSLPGGERSSYLDGWDAAHKAHVRALETP
jgi:Xaa-Pro aminopeptidase